MPGKRSQSNLNRKPNFYACADTLIHISSFTQHLVTNLFLHNIPNVLNGIYVGKFPGHSRRGNPLHSRNVQVLLELCHGARTCIKYIISLGPQRIHLSLYFAVITTLLSCLAQQNENHHAKCNQTTVKLPVSVQVWGAIIRREKL